MKKAEKGDVVRLHFSSFLEDGTIYESTLKGEPLRMTIGEGSVVPGFDRALTGMKADETKTVLVEAEDAYGLWREDMVLNVRTSEVKPGEELKVGGQVTVSASDGERRNGTITGIGDNTLQVDANHPLAGQYVIFEIKLIEIL
jgi:FKBP-type peptidyl-prolyl cis-trans isomerase 2